MTVMTYPIGMTKSGDGLAPTTELSSAMKLWRWRVFVSTWLCYAGYYFCRKPFSIAKSQLGLELDFDAARLGTIYAAYLIAYTAGQFASGIFGARFGPRLLLLAGMAVTIAASFAFAFVDSFVWFIVFMTVNGLAQATGWSNTVGTMASWTRRSERGTVMGIWATNFQVGGILSNALAAFILARAGYQWAFASGAIVLMVVWVFFYFNQANRPEDKGLPALEEPDVVGGAPAADSAGPVKWSKDVWLTVMLVGAAYFGMKFIRYAVWSWAPFVLERNFGLKGDDAGYVSTLFDVCGIVGVIAAGWVSDRFFRGRRAMVSFIMMIGCVAATLLMVTIGAESVVAFSVCISLVGFTLFGPDALLTGAGAQDIGGGGSAVRAAGIISGLGSAGSVLQELVIGKMYTNGGGAIGPVLATLLGSALLSMACIFVVLMRNRSGKSDM